MSVRNFLFPMPFALLWMVLTDHIGIFSFVIGYVLAWCIGFLVIPRDEQAGSVTLNKIPGRIITSVIYVVRLLWDIFLSGIDVALRAFGLRPVNRSGIVAVPLQLEDDNEDFVEVAAGLSTHGITITPGELVVAYLEDEKMLYVHCLDIERSKPNLERAQAERIATYRRILGHD